MAKTNIKSSYCAGLGSRFQNTLWSRVLCAGGRDGTESRQAAEELCQRYWYPLYAFVRRSGRNRHDARDLTQGFFAYLFENEVLQKVDTEKGRRFRSFLLAVLKNFMKTEAAAAGAIKRGGKTEIVSIDEETADGRYLNEPATDLTPDKLYDRRWAMMVLEESLARLKNEYERSGQEDLYAQLRPFLTGDPEAHYAELAARLHKQEVTVRMMISRLRKRRGRLIKTVIADTVSDPEQVEIEFKHLLEVLREC